MPKNFLREKDKIKHTIVCFIVTIAIYLIWHLSRNWCLGITMGLGFGKEGLDVIGGRHFDWNDITANLLGCLFAIGVITILMLFGI